MINFIVPEFYQLRNIWTFILNAYNQNNKFFKHDRKIYSIYGCFPNMIWNGGRVCVSDHYCTENEVKEIFDHYNKLGVKLALTMTNLVVNETHLNDEYCNMILRIANNPKYNTEIIIANDILEDYIRKIYRNFKYTKSIQNANFNNPIFKDEKYNLTVMCIDKNKDFGFLKNVKQPEKVEILLTQDCIPNCPLRLEHLKQTSICQLNHNKNEKPMCKYEQDELFWSTKINNNDLYMYIDLGYKYFKLTDRDVQNSEILLQTFNNICDYLIEDKYKQYILEQLKEIGIIWL